jgi:1,4-dihydroxy-2-naphthoate octaprenyltransferase
VGKNTLVVRLGRRSAARWYSLIILLTYGSVLAGIAMELLPQAMLLVLVTAPLAIISSRAIRKKYDDLVELGPICGRTVMLHFVTGILLSVGYAIDRLILGGARLI